MAADLHIHVMPNEPVTGTARQWVNHEYVETPVTGVVDEKVLDAFFSNTIGSRWFKGFNGRIDENERERAVALISETPNVWVGEVSWLKAALFEDDETYIPNVVQAVSDIIDENLPVIDDELISKIEQVFTNGNKTSYEISSPTEVIEFLKKYKGLRCFTVSW